jgi:hypothetical protein
MQSRIASVLISLVGVWLIVSPFFITLTGAALVNTFVVGALFVIIGAVQFLWENTLPSWMAGLVAVWLGIAIAVFSLGGAALWSYAVSAVVAFVLAGWDGVEMNLAERHHHVHA